MADTTAPRDKGRSRWTLAALALVILAAILFRPLVSVTSPRPPGRRIVLWHSQRGAEKEVLETLVRAFNAQHAGEMYVEPLEVPDGSAKDKLLRTVPRGAGPDVFIRPHNELGELLRDRVAKPVSESALPIERGAYVEGLLDAVTQGGELYGVPLTYKGLLVFYNTKLFPTGPPASMTGYERVAKEFKDEKRVALAYDTTNFFCHAPFFLGYGGEVFDGPHEHYKVFEGPGAESFHLPGELTKLGVIPEESDDGAMKRLFESGEAGAIITGPWYTPGGDIAKAGTWDVAPLPSVRGRPMGSFVSVEAAFVSASTHDAEAAEALARYLGGPSAEALRFERLSLAPVARATYDFAKGAADEEPPLRERIAAAQRLALKHGRVTPSSVRMAAVWNPAGDVVKASARGADVEEALDKARFQLDQVEGRSPAQRGPALPGILLAVLLLTGTILLVRQVRTDIQSPDAQRARLVGSWGRAALGYLAPGVVATIVLVLVPAVVAMGMSLFEYEGGRFVFVGLDNFGAILVPPAGRAFEARSFYFALAVTVLWTVLNVTLHLTIGVALALLLRPAWVRFRTGFRMLLVLPWAIPNYITALMWKGMFNAQVGAINALLAPFGFEGFPWFKEFHTAFFANLVTNTWLGFPFMMVVTLGALTSLPKEIEEAATLDGASRWQRLVHIVLPHIRPALVPSVILGSVWTFNMFNIVYLVSGGEPGSKTDILVSEAYRWAFERGQRYGFAAAYSVLIFAVLVAYGRFTRRVSKDEE